MQANIIISKPVKTLSGTIQLTGSKSECNRALIIEALSKGKVKVQNVSDAADAVTLKGVLSLESLVLSKDENKRDSELQTCRYWSRRYGHAFFDGLFAFAEPGVYPNGNQAHAAAPNRYTGRCD